MTKAFILMTTLVLMLLICLLSISKAEAQTEPSPTVLSVNIRKAWLAWDWEQLDGPMTDGFDVHCGIASGVYNPAVRYVGSTIRSVPIVEVVPGAGTWFCVVTSFNEFGDSTPSNEVTFKTGNVPHGPGNTRIESR